MYISLILIKGIKKKVSFTKFPIFKKGSSKTYVTLISVIFDPLPPYVTKRNVSALPPLVCYVTNYRATPPRGLTSVSHAILCYVCVKVFT